MTIHILKHDVKLSIKLLSSYTMKRTITSSNKTPTKHFVGIYYPYVCYLQAVINTTTHVISERT